MTEMALVTLFPPSLLHPPSFMAHSWKLLADSRQVKKTCQTAIITIDFPVPSDNKFH